MGRFCYCSKVLPQKSEVIRTRKAHKESHPEEEDTFWSALNMTGFSSWLQPTPEGDYMIHCLEGESLEGIFKGLREQIQKEHPIAMNLHAHYLDVLGKDYSLYSAEPQIECLLDMKLPTSKKPAHTKGFLYPLLPHKEESHRKFREESNKEKKGRHMASLAAFGVTRLTSWLQTTNHGKYIICYSERDHEGERCQQGLESPDWQEISQLLQDQTGLTQQDLSPLVERL